jgi:integrase
LRGGQADLCPFYQCFCECAPFFPVGDGIRAVVVDWVDYLKEDKLWGFDDPLFPATKVALSDKRQFQVVGIDRRHWSSAGPIRKIFKQAFSLVGLQYFNPHGFRKTLAPFGWPTLQNAGRIQSLVTESGSRARAHNVFQLWRHKQLSPSGDHPSI